MTQRISDVHRHTRVINLLDTLDLMNLKLLLPINISTCRKSHVLKLTVDDSYPQLVMQSKKNIFF